ncbi:PorV/PorQ family protein [Candidatus Neomarinimicrobiota bacterium]
MLQIDNFRVIRILPVYFLIAAATICLGQDRLTNVGTTAASFLEVGVGSQAIGMGGAYVALATDVSSLYWNPGGLGRIEQSEAIFERVDWLVDISFNYFGVAVPIPGRGTLGLSINSMTVPRSPVRTIEYPEGTGEEYNAGSIAIGTSYGLNLTDRFSLGFTAKYIQERIWHEKSSSLAIDIGTLYYTGFRGLRLGAAITNFGPPMQMDGGDLIIYEDVDPTIDGNNDRIMGKLLTDEWPLPLNMQFGIAYDVFQSNLGRLTVAVDAFHPINNTESLNAGIEYSFLNIVTARIGYKALGQQDTEEGLTLGAGLRYKVFGQSVIKIDYAYADFGRLQEINRYTLRLSF